MAASHIAFSDLKAGRDVQRVVARLLRFWEARNVKKVGELMGVDMLLVDEKGSIHVQKLAKFQPLLVEGALYVITGFEMTRSNTRFKITDFDKSIRINQFTTMDVIDESVSVIPKELFRFCSHEQLVTLSNTNKELPDVIGQVCSTKAYHNEASNKLERMLVHLFLHSGETVRLSAFNDQATTLNRRLKKKEGGTCVLLATNINPKFFGGELHCNTTSGTHFYFDTDIEATRVFSERMLNSYALLKLLRFNLLMAGISSHAQTVVRKWLSKNQLSPATTANIGVVGNVRYRVEMVVNDGVSDAVFVAFDKDMVRLTDTPAWTLAALMAEADVHAQDEDAIPETITKLVGNTYTFHIKLTSFNFTSHHRSFTVRCIYTNPHTAPKPSFATEILELPRADIRNETDVNITKSTTGTGAHNNVNSSTSGASSADQGTPTDNTEPVTKKPKLK